MEVVLSKGVRNDAKSTKFSKEVHDIEFETTKDYLITKGEGKWGVTAGKRTAQEGAPK
jgi:hypothetical protein